MGTVDAREAPSIRLPPWQPKSPWDSFASKLLDVSRGSRGVLRPPIEAWDSTGCVVRSFTHFSCSAVIALVLGREAMETSASSLTIG